MNMIAKIALTALIIPFVGYSQKTTYYINDQPTTFWDASKATDQILAVETELPDHIDKCAQLEIQFCKVLNEQHIILSRRVYSNLQFVTDFPNKLCRWSLIGNKSGYYRFDDLAENELLGNVEDEVDFEFRIIGREVTGSISHWYCDRYHTTHDLRGSHCSCGYMISENTYGNGAVLTSGQRITVVQNKEMQKRRTEAVTAQHKRDRRKRAKSILGVTVLTGFLGVIWWNTIGEE